MINNILWDFDGVILDSMKIRTDGFIHIFSDYAPYLIDKLIDFHLTNGGWSRYVKIRYFYEEILDKCISESEVEAKAQEYSNYVFEKLTDPDLLIKDTLSWIKENYFNYKFHIVSGSDEKELKRICTYLEIDKYFLSIHGSPEIKTRIIKHLILINGYKGEETIMIGDSKNDQDAAIKNGIEFYGYNNNSLDSYNYIEGFKDFSPNQIS